MSAKGKVLLSPSTLNLFRECPRCFWLQVKGKVSRPKVMPSLPIGMDKVIKEHFDQYRGSLPPVLQGKVDGKLPLERAGTLLYENNGVVLKGILDEWLETPDGCIIPMDHKTRASAPAEGGVLPIYTFQMSTYTFLLEKTGRKTKNLAHLLYYYPLAAALPSVEFGVTVETVTTEPESVQAVIDGAVQCLAGEIPQPSEKCEFCGWAQKNFANTS